MNVRTAGALVCAECTPTRTFIGTDALNSHYRHAHDPLQFYQCGQQNCRKVLLNKTSWIRHITSTHKELFCVGSGHYEDQAGRSGSDLPCVVASVCASNSDDESDVLSVAFGDDQSISRQTAVLPQEVVDRSAIQLLADLRSTSSLTGRAVERFQSGCFNMLTNYHDSVVAQLSSSLSEIGLDEEKVQDILKPIASLRDPFEHLRTIDDQLKFFNAKFGVVIPKAHYLDTTIDRRLDSQTNLLVPTEVIESFQYVSVIENLKAILCQKKNREIIFKDHTSKDEILRSYFDGSHFKNHPFLSKYTNVICLLLYYDELETANALGSKTIIHKLGAFFYQLLNLPPEVSSELSSIHLLALAYADDMKKDKAFDKVLSSFVQEMKKLSSDEGVLIDINGEPFKLRAVLVALTADTPAAHDVLGFLGASALHFCRKCMISRGELRANSNFVGEPRTRELHQEHLNAVLQRPNFSKQCGVKTSCVLDDVPYFHCVENNVFDAFHDLLEGIVPLDIRLVLRHYILVKKKFSVRDLNEKIASFSYGTPDSKNKPTANFTNDMLRKKFGKLKQTGSQMWCLMRSLPFLICSFISEVDDHMKLIFLLQDMLQIIFSFEVSPLEICRLEMLIQEHNECFKNLFIDGIEQEPERGRQDDREELEEGVDDVDDFEAEMDVVSEVFAPHASEDEAEVEEEEERDDARSSGHQRKKPFKVHMVNKLHHLCHYGEMIRQFGPAVRVWCAKFEGRLKIFRQHSAVCCNFKNIPKTMANMFQLSNLKTLRDGVTERSLEFYKGKSRKVCESEHSTLLIREGFSEVETVIYTNSVTVNGEEYRPGLFVCLPGSASFHPDFAIITNIIVAKNEVFLVVKRWQNRGCTNKYNAFLIIPQDGSEPAIVSVFALANFRCIAPWISFEKDVYLSLRTVLV